MGLPSVLVGMLNGGTPVNVDVDSGSPMNIRYTEIGDTCHGRSARSTEIVICMPVSFLSSWN